MDFAAHRRANEAARLLSDPQAKRDAERDLRQAREEAVEALSHRLWTQAAASGWSPSLSRAMWTFNRLNVFAGKEWVGAALTDYWDAVIEPKSDAPLAELLWGALTHPAMLMYLDNVRNRKGNVNENLGREWLEVHTLGVDGGYTQADVQAMATWLTGWGMTPLSEPDSAPDARSGEHGLAFFNARQHDFSAPEVLGWRTKDDGARTLRALVTHLSQHPATLKHWAREWLRAQTGREPQPPVWQAATAVLSQHQGRISALQAWAHAHSASVDVKPDSPVKPPWQWLAEALHAVAAGRPLLEAKHPTRWTWMLSQPMFRRTSPDGYPMLGAAWANSGQLVRRWDVARELVGSQKNLFGQAIPPQDLLRTPALAHWREHVSADTDAQLRAAPNAYFELALLLVSPEVLTHEWVFRL